MVGVARVTNPEVALLRRVVFIVLLLFPGAISAQSLAGTYVFYGPNGPVTLSLQQQGAILTGTMSGAGLNFTLRGTVEGGRATGSIMVGDGAGWFAAGFAGNQLKVIVAELDENGQPDLSSAWNLDFTPTGGVAQGAMGAQSGNVGGAAQDWGGQPGMPGGVQQGANSPLVQQWLAHLSGKKLSYRESYGSFGPGGGGGYSNNWDAYLCSDGTFFFRSSSNVGVDVGGVFGSAGGGGVTRGTWRIIEYQGQAVIQYQMEGSGMEYGVLTFRNGVPYLDQSRIYVTNDNPYCR